MKRKLYGFFILVFSFISAFGMPSTTLAETLLEQAQEAGYQISETDLPQSGIVIEAESGQILWEQEAENSFNPVGLSNLMTLYLTYEAIDAGNLRLDTIVTTTENQQAIGQLTAIKNNTVVAGVEYTISDLIQLAAVPSSNVATIMLSNAIEEQDGKFVALMNEKAEELGMTQTSFNTATGVPAVEFEGYYQPDGYDFYAKNKSTVKDFAILTYYLLKDYPEILEITKNDSLTILPDSLYEETFESDNELLDGGSFATQGVDGMKFTSDEEAGFHGITTASQDGWRVITILSGVGDSSNLESKQSLYAMSKTLIDSTFDTYSYKELLAAGEQTIDEQILTVENDFYAVIKNDTEATFALNDNGQIELTNSLPLVSEDLSPITASYKIEETEIEQTLEEYPFLTTLFSVVEITKSTILSVGAILLGLIFLLMSIFVPSEAPVEAEEEEIFSRRQRAPKKTFPFRKVLIIGGLTIFLIGVVILSVQYIF